MNYFIRLIATVTFLIAAINVAHAQLITQWGVLGDGDGELNDPKALVVDSIGNVYVADDKNNRIQKFTYNGIYVSQWGHLGSNPGEFQTPFGVTVDAINSYVYVADYGNHRIQKFDSVGNFILTWGSYGVAEGQFRMPKGMDFDSAQNLYVIDHLNHRIQKFDSDGTFLMMWGYGVKDGTHALQTCLSGCQSGISGSADGQLYLPFDLAIDDSDNVYVADGHNHRIQKFDNAGNFLAKWGTYGTAESQFQYPTGVAVDEVGGVYVADLHNNRIQYFFDDADFGLMWGFGVSDGLGTFQTCFEGCKTGLVGDGVGQFNSARSVSLGPDGFVYALDQLNHRVQKFELNYVPPVIPSSTCIGFEPPMATYPVTVKKNRALPLKAEVFNADGLPMSDADFTAPPVVQVWFDSGHGDDAVDVTDEVLSVGQGDEGNQFVFTGGDRWQYNLSTKNYTSPGTYTVLMETGDSSEYVFEPMCMTEFVIK